VTLAITLMVSKPSFWFHLYHVSASPDPIRIDFFDFLTRKFAYAAVASGQSLMPSQLWKVSSQLTLIS
jgi:hypothetical protein